MLGDERTAAAREIIEAAYNAYFDDVYKFVFRGVGNVPAAEDITHDVFCAALNRIQNTSGTKKVAHGYCKE